MLSSEMALPSFSPSSALARFWWRMKTMNQSSGFPSGWLPRCTFFSSNNRFNLLGRILDGITSYQTWVMLTRWPCINRTVIQLIGKNALLTGPRSWPLNRKEPISWCPFEGEWVRRKYLRNRFLCQSSWWAQWNAARSVCLIRRCESLCLRVTQKMEDLSL